MSGQPSGRPIAVALTVLIAIVVAAGLNLVGSPGRARLQALDERRVDDLRQITLELASWWREHRALPAALDTLAPAAAGAAGYRDPATGTPYEYRVTGDSTYDLCATFSFPTEPSPGRYSVDREWRHPAGRHCFPRREK